jgi:predicted  nucleic acid-binding Zn-ribbon protein
VNADHSAQLRLLDLQAADTAISQLRHRRASLPELAAIADRDSSSARSRDELVDAETRAGDIAQAQRRLENEVDAVRARAERDEQRLRAGGLPAKELSGLQHEITTLARRQTSLEDELLEIMEERETVDGELAELTRRQAELSADRDALISTRDEAFGEIDSAIESRTREREAIVAELPADLVALYERAREHGGGVGAARLRQRRCEGCRIELSGSELAAARAAAPDQVLRCENCRRILVRADDAGL